MKNDSLNVEMFRTGIPFDEPLDVKFFENIPNADTARRALDFMMSRPNEVELAKRHTPEDIARLWRAAFRGCLTHGVPIPDALKGYAQRLGVVLP